MPSRNIVRFDADYTNYHVYIRGINKSTIFAEEADKQYFLGLFARHLSKSRQSNSLGYPYPHYYVQLKLLSYCILDNHAHLLLYQIERGATSQFMRSIMIAYTAYYNKKHTRRGPLFESRFKAKQLDSDQYLQHISRYIHLNPRSWKRYAFSSYYLIAGGCEPEWLHSDPILELFGGRAAYQQFVAEYVSRKAVLDQAKAELANL